MLEHCLCSVAVGCMYNLTIQHYGFVRWTLALAVRTLYDACMCVRDPRYACCISAHLGLSCDQRYASCAMHAVPTESRSLTRACRMDVAYCPCDAHPQGSVGTLCLLGYAVLRSLHLCTFVGSHVLVLFW